MNFIKDIKNRLNNALKEAAQTASDGIKEKEENPERVEQDGFWGGFKRLWGGFLERIGVMNQALKPER
ncbi:hypothetical protein HpHA293_11090 [Helicobacter pylori]